jgi:PhoPQ-activated pathogenicity-related protein
MTKRRRATLPVFAAALLLAAQLSASIAAIGGQAPALASAPAAVGSAARTALDRYVEAPDPSYKYEVVATIPGKDHTTTLIDMTSQTWRSPNEVDRTVWKHWLLVVRPSEVKHDKAFLYITGGNNTSPPPKNADENLVRIATTTGSVVAELRMVPNQPLAFADDKRPRVEDDMIAYTWDKFLRGGDDQWPARLPMTKAAVRAMDTVVSVCKGDNVKVDGFVVAGASKRG